MVDLNLNADFVTCVDNLEQVILRRRGSTKELAIKHSIRQRENTKEAEPSNGSALQSDAVWQLQLAEGEAAPQVGDLVIDAAEKCWTILEIESLSTLGRWKCVTRDLQIAKDGQDRVNVERAVWDDIGSGPEIVGWNEIFAALPVSIRLDEMVLDSSTNPPTKQLLYQIVLGESISIEPDDRLVAEDGTIYRVQSMQQAARIDALPIVTAVREEGS